MVEVGNTEEFDGCDEGRTLHVVAILLVEDVTLGVPYLSVTEVGAKGVIEPELEGGNAVEHVKRERAECSLGTLGGGNHFIEADEDEQGKSFVGRSGKLLTEMLEEVGLRRDTNIYIANMLKCRPPENRDPKKTEQDLCIEWLQKQIEIIDPKVILCVGRISAQRIIGKDFSVTKQHGELIERDGRIYMGTFHPAAILRNINNKPLMEADLKKLAEAIK